MYVFEFHTRRSAGSVTTFLRYGACSLAGKEEDKLRIVAIETGGSSTFPGYSEQCERCDMP